MPLPHYYSNLGPFREVFLSGRPVLTYHHVGPRPAGARIKGLFVSPELFDRQLNELREGGFVSAAYDNVTAPGSNNDRHVFLTFDDGFEDVFERALPILERHRFHGILFLIADLIGKTNEWQQREGDVTVPLMDKVQVRDWLAAGHEIGSHTRTHPFLTQLTHDLAKEEISASRKKLEDMFGQAIPHFCYPYGDNNESVRDLVKEAGYNTACTVEPGVNTGSEPPLGLKRFTARYPSRNLKAIWSRLTAAKR